MTCDAPIPRKTGKINRLFQLVAVLSFVAVAAMPASTSAQQAPAIVVQPVPSTNLTASEVTFFVQATGTSPLRYQWYFNLTNRLAGETEPSITYTNVGEFQEGFFSVVITNAFGSVTSTPAFLTVVVPPLVTREPTNVVAATGGTATFSVNATGDPPLRYQWYRNIIEELAGATNSTLVLTNLQKTNSGSYQIEVSNDYDTVNSLEVFLTVKDPPVITAQPLNISVASGAPASFSATVAGDGPFTFRWYFNQTNLMFGATTSSLSIANAQLANSGTYQLAVITDVGAVTSAPANLIVLQAPSITSQPVSTTTIVNSNASFSVTATGTSPLSYQWHFNRTNAIPGAIQPALAIQNAQLSNAGIYSVVITNQSGSVTSINASLSVFAPPQITSAPVPLNVRAGNTAVFSVTAGGTAPLIYRWFFNNTNLIAGASGSTLTLPNVQLTNAGSYSVLVSNLAGTAASAPVTLTVQSPPVIVQQPVNRAVLPGSNVTFSVQAIGDAPLAYQWFYNTTTPLGGASGPEFTLNNAQTANNGRYSVRITNNLGSIISAEATLAVKLPPGIVQNPASLTVTQGNVASFSVSVVGDGPFGYRWLLNGTNTVPGTNSPTLQIQNAQAASAGGYVVIVTNEVGSATSSVAQLTVRTAPAIVQQPADTFVAPGSTATFTVVVTGDQPLAYQWFFNTTNALAAQTNATLSIANATGAANGLYSVVVSNDFGFASSRNAALGVRLPPVVTVPPASLTVTQGASAAFSVAVSGDGPFGYQWMFNNAPVPGAASSTLTLNHVLPAAEGQYSVRVTNVVGSTDSAAAVLTVRPLPVISQHPASLVVTQGQTATFTVAATSSSSLSYQWRRNGLTLAGNNASLQIAGTQPANAGVYDVIVGNTYGSVTSALATLTVFGIDFGDAPAPLYPTLLANDGARHVIVPGIHLGTSADAEADGLANGTASGDDVNGQDDEDGVQWNGVLHVGQTQTIEVIASTNGYLNGWLDFDAAGGWTQSGEQVLTNALLVTGTNLLTVAVPANAITGPTFARLRFSTVSGLGLTGLAPDGEVEDHQLTIAPSADIAVSQQFDIMEAIAGNPAELTILITNHGPSTATGLFLTNRLSSRSTFLSASSSEGSCSQADGFVVCNIGTLTAAGGARIVIHSSVGAGTNIHFTTVRLNEFDPTPATANSSVIGTVSSAEYANSDVIIMPLPDAGAATPYPSPIVVSGITAAVHQIKVTLRGLNHDYPGDIDMLLVGPHGQAAILMSDAGFDTPIIDATITFDETLGQPLPSSGAITTGSYLPVNYPPANENFPAPAPPDVQTADLSQFRGTDPNGVWSLYVIDDAIENGGSEVPGFIADGWTLSFATSDPLADLALGSSASPGTVSIGEPVTYTVSVTNLGPTVSAATCTATLPPALQFVSASTPQGSCTHLAGEVTCEFGNLAPGASVVAIIRVSATIGGNVVTPFTVRGSQLDLNPANNASTAGHFVRPVVNLAVTAAPPAGPVLLNQATTATCHVANQGPNDATGVRVTNTLPSGAVFISSAAEQGSCSAAGQSVVCSLGDIPAGSSPSISIQFAPRTVGSQNFTAAAAGTEEDSNPGNNLQVAQFDVGAATDLSITAVDSPASVPLNQDYIATLEVTNHGPLAANATLTDTLPNSSSFVSVFTTRGSCTNVDGVVSCQFANLVPGETARVILRARVNSVGAITNAAAVSGSLPDNNSSNNSLLLPVTVVPNANLAIGIVDRPSPVWLGDNLVYLIGITNQGPSDATSVIVTNQLPVGITFVSATTSQGGCARSGDTVRCDLGTISANASASIAIVVRPTLSGLVSTIVSVSSAVSDGNTANNASSATTRVVTGNIDLTGTGPITTPLLGLANPYPSSVTVSNVSSAIYRVRVSLLNLSHSFADDLDVLLVGPDGRATLLMSDCGGEFTINGATLVFDDAATNGLADFNLISSGTFRPSNYGADIDPFAAPAPIGPYATNLSIFNGTDPNGTWSLYVMDDADKDSGVIAGGWRLSISAFEPMADLGLALNASQNLAGTGSNIVFSYTVTNRGPSVANSVRITNALADGIIVAGFTNANGSCNIAGGILVCDLGSIPPAGAAALTVAVTSLVPGTITNSATVSFAGVDLRPTNNLATTVVTFDLPPVITLQPATQTAAPGGNVQFIATAVGAAPLSYRWQKDGVDVPGGVSATLALNNITLADAGSYRLRVSNNVGSILSDPAQLLIPGPPTISAFANRTIDEDSDTGPIAFTVQDFDTPAGTLLLTGYSTNPSLVAPSGLTFGGSGQNRTVVVHPGTNQSGTALVSIVVQDTTGASATNSFTLTVRPVTDPIVIVRQPRNILAITGAPVTLSITAASGLPISYQWQRNGQPIAGATAATLQFASIAATNTGTYNVLLSNGETNITSASATVTLTNQLPRPTIVSITQNGGAATVTFTTVTGLDYTLEYKVKIEDAAWNPLGTISGTGASLSLTDTNATIPARFYRLRAD